MRLCGFIHCHFNNRPKFFVHCGITPFSFIAPLGCGIPRHGTVQNIVKTCLIKPCGKKGVSTPIHRFDSATGEQKWITQTNYTDSEPPSRLTNSLMPSTKLRSANLPFLSLWCDAFRDRTPASRTPSGGSNHCATRGWYPTASWIRWCMQVYASIGVARKCPFDLLTLDQV